MSGSPGRKKVVGGLSVVWSQLKMNGSSEGIRTHPSHCKLCRRDLDEKVVVRDPRVYSCVGRCDHVRVGDPGIEPCPDCGFIAGWKFEGMLDRSHRLPHSDPCQGCSAKLDEIRREVERGGVRWSCKSCGSFGALPAGSAVSEEIRSAEGVEPRVDVLFEPETCPVCDPPEEVPS